MIRQIKLDDEWEGSSAVNMVRVSHPPTQTTMGIAPLLILLKELETPKFSGSLEDYDDWRIGIRQFAGLLASEGGVLPDAFKLEMLNKALDETNRTILQTHRERGGTFEGFMMELDRRYLSDVQEHHRRKWKALTIANPSRLSRDDFREFRAKFERYRSRVLDATPEEEYALLMAKLPEDLRLKAVEEEEWRNRQRFGLRIGRISGWGLDEMEDFLTQRAREAPLEIREKDGCFLAHWANDEARTRVLALEGRKVQGQGIVVSRQRVKMSVADIFSWVETQLQIAETAQALAGTPASHVRVIAEEVQKKKDKSKEEDSRFRSPNGESKKWSERGANKGGKGKGQGWSDQKWNSTQWYRPFYGQSNQSPNQWWGPVSPPPSYPPPPMHGYQGYQQFPNSGKGGDQQGAQVFNNGWISNNGWNRPWRPRTQPQWRIGEKFSQWRGSSQSQPNEKAESSKDQPRPSIAKESPNAPTKKCPPRRRTNDPCPRKGRAKATSLGGVATEEGRRREKGGQKGG
jgi:hypothetical protein